MTCFIGGKWSVRFRMVSVGENPWGSFTRYLCTDIDKKVHPFPVAYLTETIGLSPESAISVSKRLCFKTADKPDAVVAMFRNHGFSQTQIQNIVMRCPVLLDLNAEKNLLPKLEFFYSKGASTSCLTQLVSGFPSVLSSSLEKRLIPSFELLRGLLESEEEIFRAMLRFAGLLNLEQVARNVQCLKECGMPDAKVRLLICKQPRTLITNVDKFRDTVEEVKKMGFNPKTTRFVVALSTLRSLSKSTWEGKGDVLRKWGWSEEELSAAFKRRPGYMSISEEKIAAVMDYLVNKLHFRPSTVAKCPLVFSYSLKGRIIPRASVAQVLISKGFLKKKEFSLLSLFASAEKLFLQKYVHAYEKEAPDLLKVYMDSMGKPTEA